MLLSFMHAVGGGWSKAASGEAGPPDPKEGGIMMENGAATPEPPSSPSGPVRSPSVEPLGVGGLGRPPLSCCACTDVVIGAFPRPPRRVSIPEPPSMPITGTYWSPGNIPREFTLVCVDGPAFANASTLSNRVRASILSAGNSAAAAVSAGVKPALTSNARSTSSKWRHVSTSDARSRSNDSCPPRLPCRIYK